MSRTSVVGAASRPLLDVGSLGVGTWAWGDRRLWGYGRTFGEADVRGAFEASLDAGVSLFDTAEIYGRGESERLLGRFAAQSQRPLQIATKFLPWPWRIWQRGSLLYALRASLQRLGRRQVELYQIHWPLPLLPADHWADELAEAVKLGLTLAVGVSNYSRADMFRMYRALDRRGVRLASNQVHYSLLHRAPESNGVQAACRELGVRLIAYSPLEMGLLTGRYSVHSPPPAQRRFRVGGKLRRADVLLPRLRDVGERSGGRTPAQVALNWLVCHQALPIPGAKTAEQARQNAGSVGWTLSPADLAMLDRLSAS